MTILRPNYYNAVTFERLIVIIISLWKTYVFHRNPQLSENVLWIIVDNFRKNAENSAPQRKNRLWRTVDKIGDN